MDVARANELFDTAQRLVADAQSLRDALQVEFLSGQLAEVVATDYDLGDVLRVEQILGGYTNLSFAVVVATPEGERKYFVRKYNRLNSERRGAVRARARQSHQRQGLPHRRAGVPQQARRDAT